MSLETLLQQAQRPLLIAHIAPDGDAIGSLLGLGWALKEVGRRPTLACADPVPGNLHFLPGAAGIVTQPAGDEDAIVALDSSDLVRLGNLYDEALFERLPVLNIDHHVTNVGFGTAQLVDQAAAATAQIVYALLRRLHWPVSAWTATCLLTGLVTDTRSFRTTNTDAEVVRTALHLMEAGAPLAEINAELEHGLSLGAISLWGRVLSGAQLAHGIICAEVSLAAQRECGVASADTSGLVSFLAGAREARIAVLLTEKADGRIEVGMRSVPGVDVSGIALVLGGGGHRQAAGCTMPGPLAAARAVVLARLAQALPAEPVQGLLPKPLGDSNVGRTLRVPSEQ